MCVRHPKLVRRKKKIAARVFYFLCKKGEKGALLPTLNRLMLNASKKKKKRRI